MGSILITLQTMIILHQLWQVGEQTADLVAIFEGYDKVSGMLTMLQALVLAAIVYYIRIAHLSKYSEADVLEAKVRHENRINRHIHYLLFDSSPAYGEKSLFDLLHEDMQSQIQILFERALGSLNQAIHSLTWLLGTTMNGKAVENSSTLGNWLCQWNSGINNIRELKVRSQFSTDVACIQPHSWTVYDKQRIEMIIHDFSDLNSKLINTVQLWCHAAELGVDRKIHLQRLANDPNSRALGLDIDARLQIATIEPLGISRMAETEGAQLNRGIEDILGGRFGIGQWRGQRVLVNYRKYASDSPVPFMLDDYTRKVISKLANLLHQPKEMVFRMPKCLGWTSQMHTNRVAFLFTVPDYTRSSPTSLLQILRSRLPRPSLGDKFTLALQLAKCISQMQLVKWAHEDFRSDNILFYPKKALNPGPGVGGSLSETVDLSEPWVLGFGNIRPGLFMQTGLTDLCPESDVYRHPNRQQWSTEKFKKICDIYAFGVVLLEIGLWQEFQSLEEESPANSRGTRRAIRRQLVGNAKRHLASHMGDKYKDVVLKCLHGEFGVKDDNMEDLKLQQAFRFQVVDVLERAAKGI